MPIVTSNPYRSAGLQFNRGFAYAAAVLFFISIPVGTWVFRNSFRAINIAQWLFFSALIAGLVIYITGRNDFLKHTRRLQATPIFLAVFGAFLVLYGASVSLLNLLSVEFYVETSLMQEVPLNVSGASSVILDYACSSFWTIIGVVFILDWIRLRPKAFERGLALLVVPLIALWEIFIFEFHTGLWSFFFGYAAYLTISVSLIALTLIGLVMIIDSFRKKMLNDPARSANSASVGKISAH